MTAAQISIDGTVASVRFERYDLEAYETFLRCKGLPESRIEYDWQRDVYTLSTPARYASRLGAAVPVVTGEGVQYSHELDDYQVFVLDRALEAQRFACWLDTGLGKTRVFLEWARQVMARTGEKVLILAPLNVISQHIDEASLVYGRELEEGPGNRFSWLRSREDLCRWLEYDLGEALGIANYEQFIPGQIPELRNVAGIVLDESSILKSGGGVIKWNLIHSATGIEYKLSCTATPAPNDAMEYASQARFLDKFRSEGEVLWTFYSRDEKSRTWQVKPHAREAFYRWMADWSIYMRNPATWGFRDVLADLPEPEVLHYEVPMTPEQETALRALQIRNGMGLFSDRAAGIQQRMKLSEVAKGFLYGPNKTVTRIPSIKPGRVADIVRSEMEAGRQCLVWTVFDEEAAIIAEELRSFSTLYSSPRPPRWHFEVLDGRTPKSKVLPTLQAFKAGDIDVLISKAQLLGYGLNFQNCTSTVFSGFDDSFERLYQAQRRFVRRGQTQKVRIHIPAVPELEGMVFDNLKAKEAAYLRDVEMQERFYIEAMKGAVA